MRAICKKMGFEIFEEEEGGFTRVRLYLSQGK
jgi:hypothetical protein